MEHQKLSAIASQQEMIRFLEMYPLGASSSSSPPRRGHHQQQNSITTTNNNKKTPLVLTTSLTPFNKMLSALKEEEGKQMSVVVEPSPPSSRKPKNAAPPRSEKSISINQSTSTPQQQQQEQKETPQTPQTTQTQTQKYGKFDAQGNKLISATQHEATLSALLDIVMKRFNHVVAVMSARHAQQEQQIAAYLSTTTSTTANGNQHQMMTGDGNGENLLLFSTPPVSTSSNKKLLATLHHQQQQQQQTQQISSSPSSQLSNQMNSNNDTNPLSSALRNLLSSSSPSGKITPTTTTNTGVLNKQQHHHHYQQDYFIQQLLSANNNTNDENNHHSPPKVQHAIDTVSREMLQDMDVPLDGIMNLSSSPTNQQQQQYQLSQKFATSSDVRLLDNQLNQLIVNLFDDQYVFREVKKKSREKRRRLREKEKRRREEEQRKAEEAEKNNNTNKKNNKMMKNKNTSRSSRARNIEAERDFLKKEKERKKRGAAPSSIPVPHQLNLDGSDDCSSVSDDTDSDGDNDDTPTKKLQRRILQNQIALQQQQQQQQQQYGSSSLSFASPVFSSSSQASPASSSHRYVKSPSSGVVGGASSSISVSSTSGLPTLSNRSAPKHLPAMFRGYASVSASSLSMMTTTTNNRNPTTNNTTSNTHIVCKSVDDLLPPLFSPQRRRQMQLLEEQRSIFATSNQLDDDYGTSGGHYQRDHVFRSSPRGSNQNQNQNQNSNNNKATKPKKDFSLGRKVRGIEVRQHFTVDDAIQNSTATLAAIRGERERRRSIHKKHKQLKGLFPKPDDDDNESCASSSSSSDSENSSTGDDDGNESLSSDNSLYEATRINMKLKQKRKQLMDQHHQTGFPLEEDDHYSASESLLDKRKRLQDTFFKDANQLSGSIGEQLSPFSPLASKQQQHHFHHHQHQGNNDNNNTNNNKSAATIWCEQAATFARELLNNLSAHLNKRNIKALTEKQAKALLKDDLKKSSSSSPPSSAQAGTSSSVFSPSGFFTTKNNNPNTTTTAGGGIFSLSSSRRQSLVGGNNDSDMDFDDDSSDEDENIKNKNNNKRKNQHHHHHHQKESIDMSVNVDDLPEYLKKQAENYLTGGLDIGRAKKKSHEEVVRETEERIKELEENARGRYVDGGMFMKSLRFEGNAFTSSQERNWNKPQQQPQPEVQHNRSRRGGDNNDGEEGGVEQSSRRRKRQKGGYLAGTSSSTARSGGGNSNNNRRPSYFDQHDRMNANNPMNFFSPASVTSRESSKKHHHQHSQQHQHQRQPYRPKSHSIFGPRQFLGVGGGDTQKYQFRDGSVKTLSQPAQSPVAAPKLIHSQQRNVGALARAVTRSFVALSQARNRLAKIGITRDKLLEMISGQLDIRNEVSGDDDDDMSDDDDDNHQKQPNSSSAGDNNKDNKQRKESVVSSGSGSSRRSMRRSFRSDNHHDVVPHINDENEDDLNDDDEEEVPLVARERPQLLSHLFYGSEEELRKDALSDINPKKEKALAALAEEKMIVEALERDIRTMKGHHETARKETIQRWAEGEDLNLKKSLIDEVSHHKIFDRGLVVTRNFGCQTPKEFATSSLRRNDDLDDGEDDDDKKNNKPRRVDLSPALESMFENERVLRETLHNLGVATSNIATFMNAIESDLTCRQCFNILDHPRTLHCGHSFCSSCIPQLLFQIEDDRITAGPGDMVDVIVCSECKLESPVPGYVSNRLVDMLLEFWQQPQVRNADGIGVEVSRIRKRIQGVLGGVSKTYGMNASQSAKWISSSQNHLGELSTTASASFRGSGDPLEKSLTSSGVTVVPDEKDEQEEKKTNSEHEPASSSFQMSSSTAMRNTFRRRSVAGGAGSIMSGSSLRDPSSTGSSIQDALILAKTVLQK